MLSMGGQAGVGVGQRSGGELWRPRHAAQPQVYRGPSPPQPKATVMPLGKYNIVARVLKCLLAVSRLDAL